MCLAMQQYVPLSKRDGKDERDYDVLHEGAPRWMRKQLLEWLNRNLHSSAPDGHWYEAALNEMELDLKLPISEGRDLLPACSDDELLLLNVINWMLEHPEHRSYEEVVADILDRGGSAWQVVWADGAARLERRVVRALSELAHRVMAVGDVSGQHLQNAWREAWGINGSANEAYDQAVKAVEAALVPLVSPKNGKATLGTIILEMTSKPERFKVRLEPRRGADATRAFIGQLEVLWQSHRRHGEPNAVVQMSVDEARDAVSLAAQVVDWIQRRALVVTQ